MDNRVQRSDPGEFPPALKGGSSVLGSSRNLVTFPEGSDGKELTIELYSPYLPYAGNAGIVLLGSRSACMLWVIEKYGVGLVIALLILLLGLIQTILHGISASLNQSHLFTGIFGCVPQDSQKDPYACT